MGVCHMSHAELRRINPNFQEEMIPPPPYFLTSGVASPSLSAPTPTLIMATARPFALCVVPCIYIYIYLFYSAFSKYKILEFKALVKKALCHFYPIYSKEILMNAIFLIINLCPF